MPDQNVMQIAHKIPAEVSPVRDYVRNVSEDLESLFGRGDSVPPSNGSLDRPARNGFSAAPFARLPQFKIGSGIGRRVAKLSRDFARGKPSNPAVSFSELLERRSTPGSEPSTVVVSPRPSHKFIAPLVVSAAATLLAIITWFVVLAPADPGPVQRPVAQVTASSLNCRAEPHSTSEALQAAKRGHKLLLHDQVGIWRHVRLNGSECWVSSTYLRLTGQFALDRPMSGR